MEVKIAICYQGDSSFLIVKVKGIIFQIVDLRLYLGNKTILKILPIVTN